MRSSHVLIDQVARYATAILQYEIPSTLTFHGYAHTRHVVRAARQIGLHGHLSERQMEIVLMAAWLHDVGYRSTYQGHEEESTRIAGLVLASLHISSERIEQVLGCIEATRMPQRPATLLAEVLCDADLHHLSVPSYPVWEKRLRSEWENHLHQAWTDQEWTRYNLNFLSCHTYFTPYGKAELQQGKERNIIRIQRKE